jgi:hypothetical protein
MGELAKPNLHARFTRITLQPPRTPQPRNCTRVSSTRSASGSRRASSATSRCAMATMTADSMARRRLLSAAGSRSAWRRSSRVWARQRSSTRRKPGLARGLLSACTVSPSSPATPTADRPGRAAVVLGAVLQMVDDLQRVAQGIGKPEVPPVLAVQLEQKPADRRRRPVAIVHELGPVGIAVLHRVLLEGRDEVAGVGEIDAGVDERAAQGDAPWQRPDRLIARPRTSARSMASRRSSFSAGARTGLSAMSSMARAKA